MAECPKCGNGSNGFSYFVQGCTMEYVGMFGDLNGDECVEIHHRRPTPKTVVCNNCRRRMTRAEAMGETDG